MAKDWTLEEWETHVVTNCKNTYSLACVFAALCIKEFGETEGLRQIPGLSGNQADFAKRIAKHIANLTFDTDTSD